jgi:hypothetical protein
MDSKPCEKCTELCPNKAILGFEGMRKECNCPRVRIDKLENMDIDWKKLVLTEIGILVYGSKLSKDKNVISISLDQWADTNLPILSLRAMHRRGRFN